MATIKTMDDTLIKGWLYPMNDSAMVLLNKENINKSNINVHNTALHPVAFTHINQLTLQRRHSVKRGALVGMTTGILLGIS